MQKRAPVKRRKENFAERTMTRIWEEQPADHNPYVATSCRCHGYDLLDLMAERSYVDVLYLLFRGELPTEDQAALLKALMIGMINPGPRHPATRAAMNAGIGKTDPVHILPIALTVMGGGHAGAGDVEAAMRFLRGHLNSDPAQVAADLLQQESVDQGGNGQCAPPGFGARFGDIDSMAQRIADQLLALPGSGPGLRWGCRFAQALADHRSGWLNAGVAAAVLVDLGFRPRDGAGLFQLLAAPGLLAHGLEQANKPITAMPHVDDAHYVIEDR
ncbi:MAG TPA: citrate synthase [Gammaproteobacteria bacterium]|nr:citrate synthase [Gammaproteobacteria bacterium]